MSPETCGRGGGRGGCQVRLSLAWPDKIHPGLSQESAICFLFELGRGSGVGGDDKVVLGHLRLRNLGLGELGFVEMRIKMSP